ncbi:uridylate-specific endoribonuclease B isoform X2 [Syngnathus typhle]|uniref:uridylate-specific endoribonuclease B isoform X2 n=1 Tax=Syngnathus typhle TaxID=161592 RepID=UPI002A6B6B46|nr:uridylate-specific endoribonuclease B isoform X2 [Syngnathus typhle]
MIESERELSAMVQELWDNDVNRLRPGQDYRISLQGKAGDNMAINDDDDNDGAGYPLFKFVDENVFQKETFLAFISLLDNYVSDTGEPEIVTPEEVAENHKFLDSIVKTPTMKIAHKYLVEKQLSPQDETQFKEQLYRIWFELYARRGSSRPDSSGFEHVFVGETRGGRTVIGFHNWIQLYLQEKLGHIDYKGYSVNANSPQTRTSTSWHCSSVGRTASSPKAASSSASVPSLSSPSTPCVSSARPTSGSKSSLVSTM